MDVDEDDVQTTADAISYNANVYTIVITCLIFLFPGLAIGVVCLLRKLVTSRGRIKECRERTRIEQKTELSYWGQTQYLDDNSSDNRRTTVNELNSSLSRHSTGGSTTEVISLG